MGDEVQHLLSQVLREVPVQEMIADSAGFRRWPRRAPRPVGRDGAPWLIDWADSAWADPAADFGSIPMHHVPDVLDGYEELASLGERAEGRILRAVIGQAVRKVATSDWSEPLEQLLAWLEAGPSRRFNDWLP
jgi:hypothetical protein